jgi:hypothetical protein
MFYKEIASVFKRLFFLMFIVILAGIIISGCSNFNQAVNLDDIKLAPKNTAENYKYATEVITKGNVVYTKSFTSLFKYLNGNFIDFFKGDKNNLNLIYITDNKNKNYNLFKKGETGEIYINQNSDSSDSDNTDIKYKGIVYNVQNTDNSTQVITVKITDNYDIRLAFPEREATFKVITHEKDNCIRVPRTAIKYYGNTATIGIYKNGVKSERTLILGLIGDDYAEVISGLNIGELIVTGLNPIK